VSAPSPSEVIERLLEAVVNGTVDDRLELYAEDAVIELPFAPGGMPPTPTDRETMRARMNAAREQWRFHKYNILGLHQTVDPEVVVAEYRVHGTMTATQKAFQYTFVTVTRVRDGRIVWSRDYNNPLEMAEALKS
jgi:ketosteroid isomerase-like protein